MSIGGKSNIQVNTKAQFIKQNMSSIEKWRLNQTDFGFFILNS